MEPVLSLRVCLGKAEQGRVSFSQESRLRFHRQAISPPLCSPQEGSAWCGHNQAFTTRLGTYRASRWSQKGEQWELITSPSETSEKEARRRN